MIFIDTNIVMYAEASGMEPGGLAYSARLPATG